MATKTRIALFIDAENAPAKRLPEYLERCRQLASGKPNIARCYGNSASLETWKEAMAEHQIVPMYTPPSASKKNASDFALTIDAVSLLHRDMFDHAVIVSDDADFTQLEIHIRENNKHAERIGKESASDSAADEKKANKSSQPKKPATAKDGPSTAKAPIDPQRLRAIYEDFDAVGKPVTLQPFVKKLSEAMPNGQKGHGGWKNVLKKSGLFEIAEGPNGVVRRLR